MYVPAFPPRSFDHLNHYPGYCWTSVSRVCAFQHHSSNCSSELPSAFCIPLLTIFSQIMFPAPRAPSPRQRSASCSTDDQSSTKDRPRRLFQRYCARDLSMSSHSLATTNSHHDDLPTPSVPTHASHTTSAQSTPMTSPSTGHTSLFPGSLSSATSESGPSADSKYRTEFGMLMPGSSSAYSPIHGSASSHSSHPVSPWSRSTTESDPQASTAPIPCKHPSGHFSHRPVTAPHSPLVLAAAGCADSSPADHHTRSHSRLTGSIKNLFSRHAVPSPSRLSFNSATTTPDSEASSSSFHVPAAAGKWSMTPRKSRPPDLEISGSVAPAMPRPGPGSNTSIDAHRRYASEATAKIYNARMGSGLPTSQEGIDVSIRNVPPARGREPKTRNVLRRRPSGSAKLFKGRERGMSSPSRPNEDDADRLRLPPKESMSRLGGAPFPLTPAGAVVEAYKQQELHRGDTPSPPKLSIDDRMNSSASHDGGYDQDHAEHSPYHTVFGSSSGRRGQAGGLNELWSKFEADQRIITTSHATSSHQPSMSDPGGHSITRKLSSRWRKIVGGDVATEESPSRDRGHSKGQPSLQGMWGVDKTDLRSTGRSMDGVSNADGAWATPMAGHARLESEKEDRSEGPKLWRLVRRISTGALRDRSQSGKAVPPVPAIPKDLLEKVNQGEHNNEPLSRHQPSSSSPDKDHTRTSTAPKSIAITRPSVATSSSSPNSSDVASAQFFQKAYSTRSSVSSYGEAVVVPRIPEPMLDRHIITPLEQLRLGDDHVESSESSTSSSQRTPRRSTSVPAGLKTVENAEGDHVPLPSPRRQTCPVESPSSASSRPSSMSASASGSARASYQSPGAALGRSRMADGTVSLSPPPRPPRNSRRGGGGSVASSPSHSMMVKQVDGGAVIGIGIGIGGARQIDRTPSAQSDMTARVESPEPGRSQGRDRDRDASPHTRTHPTFRELNAPRRPPLSEREKADIWNDLLARSDQAGGTLHINGAEELMSDSMRLSTHSEV